MFGKILKFERWFLGTFFKIITILILLGKNGFYNRDNFNNGEQIRT